MTGMERGAGHTALAEGQPLLDAELSLADLVDHLLNRGVVVAGGMTISVAGIDLIYLGLRVVLASVEALERRTVH